MPAPGDGGGDGDGDGNRDGDGGDSNTSMSSVFSRAWSETKVCDWFVRYGHAEVDFDFPLRLRFPDDVPI